MGLPTLNFYNRIGKPWFGLVVAIVITVAFGLTLTPLPLPVIVCYTIGEARLLIDTNTNRIITIFAGLTGITSILFSIFHSSKKDEGFLLVMFQDVLLLQIMSFYASVLVWLIVFKGFVISNSNYDYSFPKIAALSEYLLIISILFAVYVFYRLIYGVTSGILTKRYYESLGEISGFHSKKDQEQERKKRNSLLNASMKAIADQDNENLKMLLSVYNDVVIKHTSSLVAGDPVRTYYELFERALESKNKDTGLLVINSISTLALQCNKDNKLDLLRNLVDLPGYLYELIESSGLNKQLFTAEVSRILKSLYRVQKANESKRGDVNGK